MNALQLLAHFDRISKAPNAIQRLRQFILDLAVRGRLVTQHPEEEPAFEILKRVGAEKAAVEPFFVPPSWVWISVAQIANCRLGKMLDKVKNKGNPRRYLRNTNVRWFDFDLSDVLEMRFEDSELEEFKLRKGDVLICEGGEPGRAAVWDERENDISFQKAIHRVRLFQGVVPEFFVKVLRQSADSGRLAACFTGVGIKHLTGKGLGSFVFPLPPHAEQRRILTRLDELMVLCAQLEAAQNERENQGDRLAAASFRRLNYAAGIETPGVFREHASFCLNHLPRLTTRPEHIEHLRRAILKLAIRGQLVSQSPQEEPASEFLNKMRPERTRRLGAGEIHGRESLMNPIRTIEGPFAIPASWIWVLMESCFEVAGGIQKTPHRTPRDNAYSYVGVGNVYRGQLDLSTVKRFELIDGELQKFRLLKGDILIVEGNGSANEIGRCAVWNGEIGDCVHQNHIIRCRPFCEELVPFVSQYLNSQDGIQAMKTLAVTTSGLYNLSVGKIRTVPFPLPPIAEQQRIVAKVSALMVLCDQLELSLTESQIDSRRLLEAVLHDAMAPASAAMGPQ